MSTRRQFERNDLVTQTVPGYGTRDYYRVRAIFDYWSNRENGQLVKKESPCDIKIAIIQNLRAYQQSNVNGFSIANHGTYVNGWTPTSSRAYLKAYGKFKEAMKRPSSEVLLNIVEANKSLEMIASRAFQLRQLVNSVKKGRLGDAWRYMSLNPDSSLLKEKNRRRRDFGPTTRRARDRSDDRSRNQRQMLKDLSALVLEVRYGWSPLMQDIVSALEVLTKKPKAPIEVRVTANVNYSQSFSQQKGSRKISVPIHERVTIKGTFSQKNSYLSLANDLGFLNPASIVWETVPFSFLIDWALPIGPWLGNLTDFVSIELTNGSITGKCEANGDYDQYGYGFSNGAFQVYQPVASAYVKRYVRTVGVSQLPPPPLFWNARLSPGRAINAIALLGTALNPKSVQRARDAG